MERRCSARPDCASPAARDGLRQARQPASGLRTAGERDRASCTPRSTPASACSTPPTPTGPARSEAVLGSALRGRRDDVVVATKVGYLLRRRSTSRGRHAASLPGYGGRRARRLRAAGLQPAYRAAAVIASLRRLRVERIDLLQLHGPPPADVAGLSTVRRPAASTTAWCGAFGVGCERLDVAAAWIDVDRTRLRAAALRRARPRSRPTTLLAEAAPAGHRRHRAWRARRRACSPATCAARTPGSTERATGASPRGWPSWPAEARRRPPAARRVVSPGRRRRSTPSCSA